MKKAIAFPISAFLMVVAGTAGATEAFDTLEPVAIRGTSNLVSLSDSQMEAVSAGAQFSFAAGSASTWFGIARSNSSAGTYSSGPFRTTTASSLNFAIGVQTSADASAGSSF